MCYLVGNIWRYAMKKMLLGLSAVLFTASGVMGMEQHQESALGVDNEKISTSPIKRSDSFSARSKTPEVRLPHRRSSERAIGKWAHLVPKETQDEANVTKKVNDALEEVVTHVDLSERKEKMKHLVELICNPAYNPAYANYSHMVFVTALPDCSDEECYKYSRMLGTIAEDSLSGGQLKAKRYWDEYSAGYYDRIAFPDTEEVDY